MLKGSCLCGSMRYEIDGPLEGARNCHCSICRKAHGAAFRSRAGIHAKDFRWVSGEGLITWFESSPGTHRGFCSRCGSPLVSRFDAKPEVYGLPLGCLDTDPGVKPAMHVFVGSKAPWFEITDALPRYQEFPPRMSATTLVFVRHGETSWNAEGRIQGHTDIALNGLGVAQAEAVGKRLAQERFDAVYSSDLVRAYHTARPAVPDADRTIIKDQRLRERHLGVLQGLTGEEAMAEQPAAWKAFKSRDSDVTLAGGESLGEFSRRVVGFVEDVLVRHAGKRVLVVTHGGVLDAAYRHATVMPLSASRNFPIYNASINVISHDVGRWKIESWGDVSHLPQELAMDDT